MGIAAGQGFVPVIRWRLERLWRVESTLNLAHLGSVGGPAHFQLWGLIHHGPARIPPVWLWHVAEPRVPLVLAPDPGHHPSLFWSLLTHCHWRRCARQRRPCNEIVMVSHGLYGNSHENHSHVSHFTVYRGRNLDWVNYQLGSLVLPNCVSLICKQRRVSLLYPLFGRGGAFLLSKMEGTGGRTGQKEKCWSWTNREEGPRLRLLQR